MLIDVYYWFFRTGFTTGRRRMTSMDWFRLITWRRFPVRVSFCQYVGLMCFTTDFQWSAFLRATAAIASGTDLFVVANAVELCMRLTAGAAVSHVDGLSSRSAVSPRPPAVPPTHRRNAPVAVVASQPPASGQRRHRWREAPANHRPPIPTAAAPRTDSGRKVVWYVNALLQQDGGFRPQWECHTGLKVTESLSLGPYSSSQFGTNDTLNVRLR